MQLSLPDPECIKEQPGWVQDASSNSWNIYKSGSEVVLDVLRIAVNRLAAMPENRILVLLSRGFVTGGMDRRRARLSMPPCGRTSSWMRSTPRD